MSDQAKYVIWIETEGVGCVVKLYWDGVNWTGSLGLAARFGRRSATVIQESVKFNQVAASRAHIMTVGEEALTPESFLGRIDAEVRTAQGLQRRWQAPLEDLVELKVPGASPLLTLVNDAIRLLCKWESEAVDSVA